MSYCHLKKITFKCYQNHTYWIYVFSHSDIEYEHSVWCHKNFQILVILPICLTSPYKKPWVSVIICWVRSITEVRPSLLKLYHACLIVPLCSRHRALILVLTYISYVCYHASRKPMSVVKNELLNCNNSNHTNCTSWISKYWQIKKIQWGSE